MSGNPKVSIIIPVFNGANYIGEAIDSALAQTYDDIEIIVVNDGSKDNGETRKVALSYGDKIKYYEKENGGVAAALNYGIEKMHGEYFSWLSHDDMYKPNKIKVQIESIPEGSKDVISVCNVDIVSASGELIQSNSIAKRRFESSVAAFLAIDFHTGINGCALLVPKILLEKYGPFDSRLKCTQDYDVWYRLTKHAKFVLVEDQLVLSRQHKQQDSMTKLDICTIEADKLHSRMLSEIDPKDIKKYFDNDFDYALSAYNTYYDANRPKVAAQIMRHMHISFRNSKYKDQVIDLINTEILGGLPPDDARHSLGEIQKVYTRKNAKPRLLFYSNVWEMGGMERVLSILFNELKDSYNIILVHNYQPNNVVGYPIRNSIHDILIGTDLKEKLPYSLMTICALTDSDVFVGCPNIIYDFLPIYSMLKETDTKTVAMNHGSYFLPYFRPWLFPVAERRRGAYRDADVVTWLTSFAAGVYRAQENNGICIPNPNTFKVDKNELKPRKEKIVLCVGRFHDVTKRIDRILTIFKGVHEKNPEAKLCLVGDVHFDLKMPDAFVSDTIAETLLKLNIPTDAIMFEGEQADVKKYYKKASVLMICSDTEGFSMVINEAACFGVPTVLFEIPGLEDLVRNGENGYIIERDNDKAMIDSVCRILDNEKLFLKLGTAAKKQAAFFSPKEISATWNTLLKLLTQKNVYDKTVQGIAQINNKYKIQDKDKFESALVSEYQRNMSYIIEEYEEAAKFAELYKKDHASESVETIANDGLRISALLKKGYFYLKKNGFTKTIWRVGSKIRGKIVR